MKKHGNIILVGMAGAGKSTLGVLLAKATGKHFVDTDLIIQQRTGRMLQDLIDNEGADEFLRIEEEVLSSLELCDHVIATGGSSVYSDRAMAHLKRNGTVVYLFVNYDELQYRIPNLSTRGIVFRGKNFTLRDVYEERLPIYARHADVTVDCSGSEMRASLERVQAGLCHPVFSEMLTTARSALLTLPDLPHAQAIALQTADGEILCETVEDVTAADCVGEKALLDSLAANGNARVQRILCVWKNDGVDVPSYAFRKALLAANADNLGAEILVSGARGYEAVRLEKGMR